MGMRHITGTAYGLVMRQGIEAGRAGNTGRHGIGDGALSLAKGERGHQAIDGREEHRPIKGPAVKRPAKFEPRVIDGGSRYKGVSTAPLYVVPR